MSNEESKIFGIGLSKTGTSSLAQALQRLGFRTKDCMGASRYVAGDLSSIDMDTVTAHDALTDTPIPSFYRELDARFPGSKFILTVRDRDGWLQSCKKQFNERAAAAQNDAHKRLFEDLYGTNVFDEKSFAIGYERFVAGVSEYFKDRPQDLLVLNVAAGDGWEQLCPFLRQPIPDSPFPKANVTKIRWMNIEDLVSVAESAGYELLKRYSGEVELDAEGQVAARSLAPVSILDRALQAALGRDATEAAQKAAHKVILAGLKKLNPEIPVLSPAADPPAYSERKHWNHVWLVDPLDGRAAFANGSSAFSVNLALVEDGRPIYGVVHAPARGTTYFGRLRKGAFKRVAGDGTSRLPATRPQEAAAEARSATERAKADHDSRSLAMCGLLEHGAHPTPAFGPSMEWQVAAAHAVLNAADVYPIDGTDDAEHKYNSKRLAVPPLQIQKKIPA